MACGYIERDRGEMYMGHNSRYRVTPGHAAVVVLVLVTEYYLPRPQLQQSVLTCKVSVERIV